jgi:hypothetical protein
MLHRLKLPRLFPYHPFGSVRTSADVADSEGPRLQKLFEDSLGE